MNNEIHLNEPFGYEIYQTITKYNLKKNLEIGSWDGEGSTNCFVEAMKLLSNPRLLVCVEIIEDKFLKLRDRYSDENFVTPVMNSSINYDEMIYKDFESLWNSPFNKIRKEYSKELVQSWFDRDINLLKTVEKGAIAQYKTHEWDSVLIDGGEFTGYSEYALLKDKTKIFFLDDVHHAFKCNQVYHELLQDTNNWELLKEDKTTRNGFAIFKRK